MKSTVTIAEIMERLGSKAPHLAENCYLDREWVWYCGPSLRENPADRAVLKEMGFRWSKAGHLMPDGKTVGTWGHSCQKPMFPRRKKPSTPAAAPVDELAAMFANA